MEGIFSLPYSEFETILQVQKHLKKADGFSVLIPTSRQQKGFDFVVINTRNCKVLRVQVKSSRSYVAEDTITRSVKQRYRYSFWFNNFLERYTANDVDYYLLFGLYPIYDTSTNIKSKDKFWKSLILAFSDAEMRELLQRVQTKRTRKPDRFFGVGFNTLAEVYGVRGFLEPFNLTKHLLANKIPEILSRLK